GNPTPARHPAGPRRADTQTAPGTWGTVALESLGPLSSSPPRRGRCGSEAGRTCAANCLRAYGLAMTLEARPRVACGNALDGPWRQNSYQRQRCELSLAEGSGWQAASVELAVFESRSEDLWLCCAVFGGSGAV